MLEGVYRRPMVLVLGTVLVALAGLSSARRLPVDLFPDLDYPLINVITHYPAGTAEDLERLVTGPIENAMLGLTNLQRVRSLSAPGFSQVTVEFGRGVGVIEARQIVGSRLAEVEAELPSDIRPEIENIGTSLAVVSTYALAGPDPLELRAWAQYELAPRLEALPGVARVQVMGGGRAAFRVDLDPDNLVAHGVSPQNVIDAIGESHVLDTGGTIDRHGRDLLIRTDGQIRDIDVLGSIVVRRGDDGRPVLLRDVAHVYRGALPERYRVTANRRPAVVFTVQKQSGASTLRVSRRVDQALQADPGPEGAHLTKFYDQAEIIGLAYRNMRNNLLLGALLAVVTLVWVLGHNRATWIVAVTLPLAALGTLALLGAWGRGLNLMTLAAITVTIGMVSDDSVIVLENIDRHRSMGKTPMRATIDGLREIVAPDLSGTLTVLAAFGPLLLVTGLSGRLFRPFGLAFSLMLVLSFVFSVALIPAATAHWLRPRPATEGSRDTLGGRMIERLGRVNDRVLRHLLRHRLLTILGAVVVFIGSIGLLALSPVRFMPLLDEDSLLVSYQLAPGTSLRESDRFGDELEQQFLALPDVASVFRRTGSPQDSLFIEGPDQGELIVRLRSRGGASAERVRVVLQNILDARPGVIGRVNEPTTEKIDESFSGLPALFGITVFSADLESLYDAAAEVEQAARTVPGISDVVNNTKVPIDQIVVRIDRAACTALSVDARDVARAVRIAMQGEQAGVTIIEQKPMTFFVRYAESARESPDAVERLLIWTQDGRSLPLDRVAHVTRESAYPIIEHQHGIRSLTMSARIEGNPLTTMRRLNRAIAGLMLEPGVQVHFAGEYRQLLTTGQQALWALLGATLLVYGVIAFQIGNLLDPLIVLVKLPIDFMGAAIALAIMRQPLDVTLPLGLITLVGVSVNNGIVLLTFTRDLRRDGLDVEQAVCQAVRVRFRPLVLTHMTTLLALLPAVLGLGHGPQLLQPLGIMLFGGLTAGTLLTFTVLPVIYVATERWRRASPAAFRTQPR